MKVKEILRSELAQSILFFVGLATVLFLLRYFVFSPVIVKGHSMDPTLADGERVIALKNVQVKRFDIVTFPAPDEKGKSYIKRVIGLPGETIAYKDDVLYIDDKKVEEPYLDEFKDALTDDYPFTDDFKLADLGYGTEKVPEDSFFVMGDNRRNSKDSRMIGFIKKEDILGDVKFVYWPLDRFGTI